MSQPKLLDTPLYALLHKDDIRGFNSERTTDGPIDMVSGDFRGLDLRELNADGVDFRDAYFRSADLRGIDFSKANLEGASLGHAQISGAYFPRELSADEILMSMNFGTRLRYRTR
ncbi:pentapeptide repeat-containing protein [Pseudomonas sp. P1.8]|uniref:pentapeptide repeat-containing protein n=1 Tax=Pseudomonas sp. P1.8 TaxID=1699310 RepID=UPI00069E1EB5|nr:pentapeptide repeat-containing protein [Pseudomonas sp. P1.8]